MQPARNVVVAMFLGTSVTCCADDATSTTGDQPTPVVRLDGAVQKGPLVQGSSVTISTLDTAGQPTGEVFNTTTINDRGEFTVDLPAAPLVDIETAGFYFNEATGLSQAPITLRAVAAPNEALPTFVNVLTHVSAPRARAAMTSGAPSPEALAEAEATARAALGYFQPPGLSSAASMNILGGDSNDAAYLLALSCSLAEMGRWLGMGTAPDAPLQETINKVAASLESGTSLSADLASKLAAGRRLLRPDACMRAITARLADLGDTATPVPNVLRALDFDGDGQADADDLDADDDGLVREDDYPVASAQRSFVVDSGGITWALDGPDPELEGYEHQAPRVVPTGGTPAASVAVSGSHAAIVTSSGELFLDGGLVANAPTNLARVLWVEVSAGTPPALFILQRTDGEVLSFPGDFAFAPQASPDLRAAACVDGGIACLLVGADGSATLMMGGSESMVPTPAPLLDVRANDLGFVLADEAGAGYGFELWFCSNCEPEPLGAGLSLLPGGDDQSGPLFLWDGARVLAWQGGGDLIPLLEASTGGLAALSYDPSTQTLYARDPGGELVTVADQKAQPVWIPR